MLMKLLFGDFVREEARSTSVLRHSSNGSDFSEIVRMLGAEDYRDTHEVVERVIGPSKR